METDRISSLHTSCLGFASLIFDLKETEEHKVNFVQLMKACDPVWKAIEADKTLPKKLVCNLCSLPYQCSLLMVMLKLDCLFRFIVGQSGTELAYRYFASLQI